VTTLTATLQQAAESPSVARSTSVVVVRDLQKLSSFIPAWEELAEHALERNVFYEHWMLLPALQAYGAGKDVGVALVLIDGEGNRPGAGSLAGLFPLRLIPRFRNLKISALSLWQHPHCYLGTPLVRADRAVECVSGLLQWLRRGASAKLLELPWIAADGPFRTLLLERCTDLGLTSWTTESFTRGLWRQATDAAGGPGAAVSGALRRRLRRHEKRLTESGRLEHVAMGPGEDIGRWIEEFLRVEASGWKGAGGSALACSESGRRYFTQITTAAFRRGRLLMLGLDYDGEPIARRCAFLAGDGSFAFKTAYDERFAHYSPGTILEIDSLLRLQGLGRVRWMDSCAAPDNALINRISNDRKAIHSLAIAGGPLGEVVIAGLRLLRWTNRRLLRRGSVDIPSEVAS
jgi:CelD/BcsL family acetyltransferase involved in cellulose biosynthesis